MTDTRQVLEGAFYAIHGREPDKVHIPEWNTWRDREIRFRRFLDAEAWESAVFMLLGDKGWHHMEVYPPQGRWTGYTVHIITGQALGENPKGYADTLPEAIALALVQAALRRHREAACRSALA